jgi:hypothetical protein
MGGRIISGTLGEEYSEWLSMSTNGGSMNCDLSGHFCRRAALLLGQHGTFGLIATNTISQGDTRATGLAPLHKDGWEFYDATDSMPWPGAAAVTVSLVHGAHGLARGRVKARLNGANVPVINSRLRPTPERADPVALRANAESAYVGSYVLGMGFTMTPAERDRLVESDPRNDERIFPYLGGEEVNTSPEQMFDRYVINFGQLSLEEAEHWPDLVRIVREKVKPERDKLKRGTYRNAWWRFAEYQPRLRTALASLERCLVTARVSKHLLLCFQPTSRVFSEQLCVFPLDTATAFAVLQSRIHEAWARLLSSSLEDRLRYSASDCFETFPFPKPDPRTTLLTLDATGEGLYSARAGFMTDTDQGLTKTYNALKDPACDDPRILDLRGLNEAMDRAVLDAYGWSDIAVPSYCPKSDADRTAIQAFEDEIIDRLYLLNVERARDEQHLGAARRKGAIVASLSQDSPRNVDDNPNKKRVSKQPPKEQGKLFNS